MIASSSTALANLAYLIGAVVLAVILGLAVWLRQRKPRSVAANMASFRKGLSALAPDPRQVTSPKPGIRPERQSTIPIQHRLPVSGQERAAAAEAAGKGAGGDTG